MTKTNIDMRSVGFICFFLILIFVNSMNSSSDVVQNNNSTTMLTEINPVTNENLEYSAIVNDNAVRVREQPSLEGMIKGQLNRGMTVSVTGRSQTRMPIEGNNAYWLKINSDDIDGWMYGAYIDLDDRQQESLPVVSSDKPITYFTKEFLEKAITGQNLPNGDVIFDRTKADGLRVHGGGRILYDLEGNFNYHSDTLSRYVDYLNYNIMIVTQEVGGIEYVRDYLILEKQNPETYFTYCQGTVRIDGKYPKFDVTVVVNHSWRGKLFTEDISQAFKVNTQTRKIEPIIFETIRLYSEI